MATRLAPPTPEGPDIVSAILAAPGAEGGQTVATIEDGIPYFLNAFWTAGQRRAHPLHEISYRACFKPQLPSFFISRLTVPGETVFDPFMGRGTSPVEAALLGRRPAGGDINPLSVLLTRPRLAPPPAAAVDDALASIDWSGGEPQPSELGAFYHPETLARLGALKAWLAQVAPIGEAAPDPVADWIRMVALTRLSGHSPGFFSGRSMPPNQAVSLKSQQRINARLGLAPPPRDVAALIGRKTRALLASGAMPSHPPALLATGSADRARHLADGSVALVVASPPFLDVVDYAADNWLRCWFVGIDAAAIAIARHRSVRDWERMVRAVLAEQARIVRTGGHVAFEVGEVRGGTLLLERLVWQAAEGLPFDRLGVMVNAQSFTKTANCWGVANGRAGTNSNRIVLLRRR